MRLSENLKIYKKGRVYLGYRQTELACLRNYRQMGLLVHEICSLIIGEGCLINPKKIIGEGSGTYSPKRDCEKSTKNLSITPRPN